MVFKYSSSLWVLLDMSPISWTCVSFFLSKSHLTANGEDHRKLQLNTVQRSRDCRDPGSPKHIYITIPASMAQESSWKSQKKIYCKITFPTNSYTSKTKGWQCRRTYYHGRGHTHKNYRGLVTDGKIAFKGWHSLLTFQCRQVIPETTTTKRAKWTCMYMVVTFH